MLYMAYDGDDAGKLVGRAVLADNAEELSQVSQRIAHGHDVVRDWVESLGGQIVSGGGDEGTFLIPAEALQSVEQLRTDYNFATGLTMTVGVGARLSEAGKSLMVGKFRGKNQVVQYEPGIEQELIQAQEHTQQGTATEEEKKITNAYLAKDDHSDCKYCKEMEDHSDDCQYCVEHDKAQESEGDCQYCAEADAKQAAPDHEHADENCQYCAEAEAKESGDHEHSGDDCQYCAEANAKQGDVAQGLPNEEAQAGQSQEKGMQTQTDLQTITSQIESDSPETQSERGIINQIDDSDIASVNQEMDDNISRPSNYSAPNAPGDLGLSEDSPAEESPDLSSVLQDGLDSHADNIQKEKVVQLISQTLEGFKASKNVLEKAKEQAPQLYEASLSMLKAMIEMAKMLGLGSEEDSAQEQPQEEQAPEADPMQQQNPAAAQEDAAPTPQQ
jgi:hypothetical protein